MKPEFYMHRCLELAKRGSGFVAPNPIVGAVLVYNDRIIGEGWHNKYGEAHAEVNCLASVKEKDRGFIVQSTMYVSLEPCAHTGKTPPCADMIIRNNILTVVIGCRDPFPEVNGKGIEKLQSAGVKVTVGVLETKCKELNKRFFTFHQLQRPYVILKWAQTADGFIAAMPDAAGGRLLISNEYSNRMVHQWRSEETAILVGTNTALQDDPELTTRLWPGASPIRSVMDMNLRLPATLKIFDNAVPTIVFNGIKKEEQGHLRFYKLDKNESLVPQLIKALYELNIQSVLVEGGATLLQSFIDTGLWDEIRIITNSKLKIGNGLAAPILRSGILKNEKKYLSDTISTWLNDHNVSTIDL
jgi:diaminohydroxyphosphoribosylaminopyrimidine deaminase / 5-amino-6-(5-phosphoribosylamino)uracil reductase